ncbi:Ankyrin repeat-containing protein [Spironucleus salmonicida]|uniref:Ankyrin repeat-containing protein n=1 Tax=Spironucleus salmonicida TaxID=348837 RepID=V6LT10_9EUKA|nr:Ankyrin repeat-containing protein [Spironucleus salmonicida]KAH0572214.1 Ankyrin repeat-containing protein [Spironucleus salmonicida]|eukprot:EST47710.1 Ankyrin repeat-containing protein [Spironucleus salmonicida]
MGVPSSIPENSVEMLHYHLELDNFKSATIMIPDFLQTCQETSRTTSLMIAARRNSLNMIELLMDELKMQDCNGQTALHKALIFNKPEAAKLLLAERDIPDKSNSTPLHFAAMSGCLELIKELKTEKICFDDLQRTPLMKAAMYRKLESVQLLTNQCGLQDDNGLTACALAAQRGYPEIVKELISEEGGIVDGMGRSLVQVAEQSDQYMMVVFLMNGCEGFKDGKYNKELNVKGNELKLQAEQRKQEKTDDGDSSGNGNPSIIGNQSVRSMDGSA